MKLLHILALACIMVIVGCRAPSQRDASNIAISKIEQFRRVEGRLPNSLSEAGAQEKESWPSYCKTGDDSYIVWYETNLTQPETYDSKTKKWSSAVPFCLVRN